MYKKINAENLRKSLMNQKGMDLLPDKIAKMLPPRYSQETVSDPMVIVKFFALTSAWTWYAIEYDPEEQIFFGFVHGHENELGYFSLKELQSLGALIERDVHFVPKPLSKVKELYT